MNVKSLFTLHMMCLLYPILPQIHHNYYSVCVTTIYSPYKIYSNIIHGACNKYKSDPNGTIFHRISMARVNIFQADSNIP